MQLTGFFFIYFVGRKDATLVQLAVEYRKLYKLLDLKECHVIIGQPGEFYLCHISPNFDKGQTIDESVHDLIKDSDLKEDLVIAGPDGIASMTGAKNG